MKLTRRKLLVVGQVLSLPAAFGQANRTPQPAPAGDELTAKRDLLRANAQAVANFNVPMATEPAFKFKA